MNRLDWQRLAERWLEDARALLAARRWAAAYYLAGYAVECGLKACILARVEATPEVVFSDRRFSEKCWTHGIAELVKLAGLEAARLTDLAANEGRRRSWTRVQEWGDNPRYAAASYQQA